ncbi:unnamed protein product [Calicophoron daubneyi]|uniref:Uncharacterized protein n=1 Tax=Calicophoron daubneyi TaxID=300641 RepID=A0AAV2TNG6_CALDB
MCSVSAKQSLALFQRSPDSLNLLQGFWERDGASRQEDIATAQRTFDSWYYGFGSPLVPGFLETVANDTGGATQDSSMHGLIREQIPDLVRISYTGPCSDIRSAARDILVDLKTKKGFRIPYVQPQSPSYFISAKKMEHMKCITEEPTEDERFYTTYALFREYWFQWGRLENYISIMGYHPEYLECYMKMQVHLFYADLPLPYPDRYYLAVMAAAEQRCIYLVLIFARRFIASGGDPIWLQGLDQGPSKWRQLARLNSILAHQPWNVTPDHIYNLTHGGDVGTPKETLSLSELMHAIAIMTHVHALASFVFGCGVRPEIDYLEVFSSMTDNPTNGKTNGQHSPSLVKSGADIAPHKNGDSSTERHQHSSTENHTITRSISQASDNSTTNSDAVPAANQLLRLIQTEHSAWEDLGEDIVAEQFTAITKVNMELDNDQTYTVLTLSADTLKEVNQHPAISRFLESSQSAYSNFEGRPLHVSEYSWQEEGLALADRLCTDLGTLLDEKFRNAYDLTYNTLNFITNVDTSLYRRTVWNQVQSLYGICHDDFRYDRVDRLLAVAQRAYLKLCATRPVMINPTEHRFDVIFSALSDSEVVHVILMVIEARQQACLLYALRAISDCQVYGH